MNLLLQQGKTDEAMQCVQLLQSQPEMASDASRLRRSVLIARGDLLTARDVTEAIGAWKQALEIQPGEPLATAALQQAGRLSLKNQKDQEGVGSDLDLAHFMRPHYSSHGASFEQANQHP